MSEILLVLHMLCTLGKVIALLSLGGVMFIFLKLCLKAWEEVKNEKQ